MDQRFLLELDGKLVGRFRDFKAGGGTADVEMASGRGSVAIKHLGAGFQELVLVCGTGMSQSFYDWVSSTFRRNYQRRNGAVITLDGRSKPISRFNFQTGLISSVAMPVLDASSNQPAYMRITVSGERISFDGSSNAQSVGAYSSAIQKAWKVCDFRIRIDGLETECRHVTKIESLSLGQRIITNRTGEGRVDEIEPGGISFSNVVLELPQSFTGGFDKWFNSSVIGGQNNSNTERVGTVDFLAPSTATSYFGLKLQGLGIVSIKRLATSAVRVEMYCEDMDFSAGGAAVK